MKMKDRVALNEVKNLSKEMYETFLRYNKGISNFMEYFFKYHALKFPEIQIFREENEDFLDDGNTRTEVLRGLHIGLYHYQKMKLALVMLEVGMEIQQLYFIWKITIKDYLMVV